MTHKRVGAQNVTNDESESPCEPGEGGKCMCDIRGGGESMCELGEQCVTKEQNKMTHEHRNEQKETQRRAGVQTPPPSTGLAVFTMGTAT